MNENAVSLPRPQGLFPSATGNWAFIAAIPLIALLSSFFVYLHPHYFELVITLDLWLLGYHHVISTYTRLAVDSQSIKEHWLLLFPLPIVVLVVVFAAYQVAGGIIIGSVYLYWQWYHYTRQSEGISKALGMRHGNKTVLLEWPNRTVFYLVPVCAFMWMISRGESQFLGTAFWGISLPHTVRQLLLFVIAVSIVFWLYRSIFLLIRNKISRYYFCYVLSHFAVYVYSYVIIDDINVGWLAINIWHNAQYIGFVWLFNNKRFSSGFDKKHPVISYLSQSNRLPLYLLACLAISSVIYTLLAEVTNNASDLSGLPMVLIVYATINFHHYIVDSQIWKLRKPSIQKNLALNN